MHADGAVGAKRFADSAAAALLPVDLGDCGIDPDPALGQRHGGRGCCAFCLGDSVGNIFGPLTAAGQENTLYGGIDGFQLRMEFLEESGTIEGQAKLLGEGVVSS